MKKKVTLNETDLQRLIRESIKEVVAQTAGNMAQAAGNAAPQASRNMAQAAGFTAEQLAQIREYIKLDWPKIDEALNGEYFDELRAFFHRVCEIMRTRDYYTVIDAFQYPQNIDKLTQQFKALSEHLNLILSLIQ